MHPIGKIIAGLVLILVGLALFALPSLQIVDWLGNFIIIVTGSIPILLIIIGLFVVWLEADELKVEREIKEEEKESSAKEEEKKEKTKRKTKRKGRKKATRRKKAEKVEETPTSEETSEAVDSM